MMVTMIRTRDFMLYVLVLIFLLVAVAATWVRDPGNDGAVSYIPEFSNETTEVDVFTERDVDTKAARLQELKAKLASGEGQLVSAPPVFTSVDTVVIDAPASSTEGAEAGSPTVRYCGAQIPHPISFDWLNNATLAVLGQTARVTAVAQVEVQNGTTTNITIEERVLADIPLKTVRSTFDSCLPDTTIGVTGAGTYLTNTDAARYYQTSSETLIGYSRDGFPIYGPAADDAELDSCGGQYENFTYQYHVRVNEPFILGCYAGVPATLPTR